MNNAAHREFKDRLFEQFARIGKALASPKRLQILDLLAQGERTVEEIAGETAMPVASASQHLQALKGVRMVEARREGLYVHYRLADEGVFRTWQAVRALGESRLAEIDRVVETYLEDRDTLEAVDAKGLMQRLATGAWSSSTFARRRSTAPGTSPARSPCRWTPSKRPCKRSPRTGR